MDSEYSYTSVRGDKKCTGNYFSGTPLENRCLEDRDKDGKISVRVDFKHESCEDET
jgi:hypothetical protein